MSATTNLRRPRTKQEMAATIDEKSVKGRRRDLPDSWTDLERCIQRSWKKTRKNQYRVVGK